MSQGRLLRALPFLFALMFLIVSICVAFAMAAHAGCCVQECNLCFGIAKLQESLRQFDGMLGILAGLLALMAISQLAVGEFFSKQNTSSLVALKARLNN